MAKKLGPLRGKTFKSLGIPSVGEKSLKVDIIWFQKVIDFL